ncbi:hypothetical protein VNO77_26921 [Canavalia gladiata]|uniref:Uncharacterized protein n=1 Tax=Canavalia gladiata TaxID=3824 RepID=A0AAN9QA21_CANGL
MDVDSGLSGRASIIHDRDYASLMTYYPSDHGVSMKILWVEDLKLERLRSFLGPLMLSSSEPFLGTFLQRKIHEAPPTLFLLCASFLKAKIPEAKDEERRPCGSRSSIRSSPLEEKESSSSPFSLFAFLFVFSVFQN